MQVSPSLASESDSIAAYSDVEAAKYLGEICHQLRGELKKLIVGQERVIDEILIAIFSGGHCIMQGVPGLAKTMLVSTLAQSMDLDLPSNPVHARSDALGHHRHRHFAGRPRNRSAAV